MQARGWPCTQLAAKAQLLSSGHATHEVANSRQHLTRQRRWETSTPGTLHMAAHYPPEAAQPPPLPQPAGPALLPLPRLPLAASQVCPRAAPAQERCMMHVHEAAAG